MRWIGSACAYPQNRKRSSHVRPHWLPVLLVENARTNRGTASAVESFRNEMVTANQHSLSLLLNAAATATNNKLIEG
jgi:hypothetical protein